MTFWPVARTVTATLAAGAVWGVAMFGAGLAIGYLWLDHPWLAVGLLLLVMTAAGALGAYVITRARW